MILGIFTLGLGIYFWPFGHTDEIDYLKPTVPTDFNALEEYVANKETTTKDIRTGNEANFYWQDSLAKTEYSIVYLHGFSASHVEGDPVHYAISDKFGYNMYLSRLARHGIDSKTELGELTSQEFVDSALEAIEIGKKIGDKVILLGCSTGGTLGLAAMAHDPEIHAGIFYSPNIDIYDQNSKLLTMPFGLKLAQLIQGSKTRVVNLPPICHDFWTMEYVLEALVSLRKLLNSTMTEETFKKITQPVLSVVWYENEEIQDKTISTDAVEKMIEQLSTSKEKKQFLKLASVGAHVMCSDMQSKDIQIVVDKTSDFMTEILACKEKVTNTETPVLELQ